MNELLKSVTVLRKFLLVFGVLFFSISIKESGAEVVWYPLPAEAYSFGQKYPEAQRLLYAFDYGHALVYERLLLSKGKISNPAQFEKDLLRDIVAILKNPPNIKVEETEIAPYYSYSFPLTLSLFDWSHLLHQFVLDVLATSSDRGVGMQRRIDALFQEYNLNSRLKITDVCKSMLFMDGHYFSKTFMRQYPSFNLLIWSYHWFQIHLYEDLMKPTEIERQIAVQKTTDNFWALISDLPDSADFDMMPETAKESPTFGAMFPRVAAAFDNNHMLHDVVSDILTSEKVPGISEMRSEGIRLGRMAQDPEAFKAAVCAGNAH